MTVPMYQWQPTTVEIARRAGLPVERVARFDHNTSPFPTDWTVPIVADAAAGLNEYPGADYRPLREAVAAATGLDPQWVVPGAGADELIGLTAQAFLRPGAVAAAAVPTYTLYRIATLQRGAEFVAIDRPPPAFALPADDLAAVAADITWLCEPNNPTGTRTADEDLERIITTTSGVVVLDAAYAEFAGDAWAAWVERHPNLVVLHTFSKALGLAGIRVGYALARPDLIAALDAARPPGSISTLSADLAVHALAGTARVKDTVAALVAARDDLGPRLADLGFRVLPSSANFLLCEVGPSAHAVADRLMALGLVVRTYPAGGPLGRYLRFTVRTVAAHDRLLEALRHVLADIERSE